MRGIVAALAPLSVFAGIGVALVAKGSAGDRHLQDMHELIASALQKFLDNGYSRAPPPSEPEPEPPSRPRR